MGIIDPKILVLYTKDLILNVKNVLINNNNWSLNPILVNVTQSVPMYCKTPNGERARCLPLNECPRILSIILDNPNEDKRRYLRESKCGYSQSSVLVCCGKDEDFKKLGETEGGERNFAYNTLISSNNCGVEVGMDK